MKKLISIILAAAMTVGICLSGCTSESGNAASQDNGDTGMNILALSGPTGIGMAKLASDGSESGDYNVTFVSAPDAITGQIVTGEAVAACVPTNLAATLYAKTNGKIQVAAVTTMGVLYILDKTGTVNSISDLAGKTMGATGQGSNPEYMLDFILEKNGLEPGKDVKIEYYGEHAELASQMIAGNVDIAMLPVPFATQVQAKLDGIKSIDLQAEWSKVCDTEPVQGVVIIRTDFAQSHPEKVEKFLSDLKASTEYAVSDIDGAAQLCEKFSIVAGDVAKSAIPYCNLTYIDGEEMKQTVSSFVDMLFSADPKATGGSVPDEGFYYDN